MVVELNYHLPRAEERLPRGVALPLDAETVGQGPRAGTIGVAHEAAQNSLDVRRYGLPLSALADPRHLPSDPGDPRMASLRMGGKPLGDEQGEQKVISYGQLSST